MTQTPPTREAELLARLDEAEALITTLRERLVALNIEVRARDRALAELQASNEAPINE